jgi:hypothetical protein
VGLVLELSKFTLIQHGLPHARWNGAGHVGEFVLASIRLLCGPFPQRLCPFFGIPQVVNPNPSIERSDKEVEERRWELRVDALQKLQRWPKGRTAAGCFGRLDDEEQLIGPGFIPLRPISGTIGNHGGKQEAVANGWAAMRVNPTLKRYPDKGRWVTFRPFPISRGGNIQLQESFGQHHCHAVIGNQAMDYRHGAKPWQYQATSPRHQLTGGSQPGGASSGVRLLVRALASTAATNRVATLFCSGHLANLPTSVW